MSHRKTLKWYSLGSAVALFVIVAVLNLIMTSYYRRVDLTRSQIYSISPELENLIGRLEDKVTVTLYVSRQLPPQFVSLERFVSDNLRELVVKSDNKIVARVEKVGSDTAVEEELRRKGIVKLPVGIIERDQRAIANIYFHLLVQYGPNSHVINMPDEAGFEYQMAHALTKVSVKQRPRVLFVQNDPRGDFLDTVNKLKNQMGLDDIYDIHIQKISEESPLVIPARTSLVVLGKPIDFREQELYELDQYLMHGGHLLVFAQPLDFTNSLLMFDKHRRYHFNLYDMLRQYGIEVVNGLVFDYGSNLSIPVPGSGTDDLAALVPSPILTVATADRFSTDSQLLRLSERLLFPLAAPVRETEAAAANDGLRHDALVFTSPETELQLAPEFTLNRSSKDKPAAEKLSSQPIAATLTGRMPSYFAGKEAPPPLKVESAIAQYQVMTRMAEGYPTERRNESTAEARLTVFGSGTMYSNAPLTNLQRLDPYLYAEQISFFATILESTALGVDLLSIRRKQIAIPVFRSDLSDSERQTARVAGTFGVPVLLAFLGIGYFVQRRRRFAAHRRSFAK